MVARDEYCLRRGDLSEAGYDFDLRIFAGVGKQRYHNRGKLKHAAEKWNIWWKCHIDEIWNSSGKWKFELDLDAEALVENF